MSVVGFTIRRGWVYLADLNPRHGTEAGKTRPVLVLQTDALNDVHPSTIVCPLTTHVQPTASLLRVHLKRGQAGLNHDSDIMVDQVRAIDVRRLRKALGAIPPELLTRVLHNFTLLLEWPVS